MGSEEMKVRTGKLEPKDLKMGGKATGTPRGRLFQHPHTSQECHFYEGIPEMRDQILIVLWRVRQGPKIKAPVP